MIVLGLNAYHGDSAAALFVSGELVAAAEEERFRRIKHWAGFPTEAIRACLAQAGIGLHQVQHVALNADPRAHRMRKLGYVLTQRPSPKLLLERLASRSRKASAAETLNVAFPGQHFTGDVHAVEHHLCHLASAYLLSPYDHAAVVSVDGFGDFSSAAWGVGKGREIQIAEQVFFPHSLGIFYQAITQYLGFPKYGDEYKVMGMAAYGEPNHVAALRQVLSLLPDGSFKLNLDCFRHTRERIAYAWEGGEPHCANLFTPELERILGPARQPEQPLEQRHKDLAASTQALYEEAFFNLLRAAHRISGGKTLALAGGCAMNSLANGRLQEHTPFSEIYVQAAAGDAGGAVGAAAWVSTQLLGRRPAPVQHAFWGPAASEDSIKATLAQHSTDLREAGCTVRQVSDEKELSEQVAAKISEGKVVGWFQGHMEWGPRALGNRSILGDPRRADMKDILNLKIKRRESFRPFAPSVLREQCSAWFETDADVPFMSRVFRIRAEQRAQIPAVTHADGTGRLQTVAAIENPRYHSLISAFYRITGVPMVLNTSFNENEPVVCKPAEALACFLRTRMDVLVIGDFLIERSADSSFSQDTI